MQDSETAPSDDVETDVKALRAERDRFRDALVAIPNGIVHLNADRQLIFANPAAVEFLGFSSVDELLRTSDEDILSRFEILDTVPGTATPDDLPGRLAFRGDPRPETIVHYRVRATGDERWANVQARPILDDEGGIKHVVAELRDITYLKRTESTLRFMTEVTTLLSSSLDYEVTLTRVAELLVPHVADWSAVQLVEENGTVSRLAVAHSDPAKLAWARQLQERFPFDSDSPTGVAYVLRTGETLYYPEITVGVIDQSDLDSERLRAVQELAPRSLIIAPLNARGRTLGAITLCMAESLRSYSPDDLTFVEDLAWRSAIAVDNARLYREAQEASLRAERYTEQLRGLTAASLLINGELSLREILPLIADESRSLTTSHIAVIHLTSGEGQDAVLKAVSCSQRYETRSDFGAAIDAPSIAEVVSRTNQPLRLTQAELESYPELHTPFLGSDQNAPFRGYLVVPLIGRDGRNIGIIQVVDREAGDYSIDDERALTQLARIASVAIENVRLFEEAQAAVSARDQFLSMAAHELKTPMTTIKGFVQLLMRRLRRSGIDSAFYEESAETLQEQITRLEILLDDLLDTSRLQYQGERIKPARVELRSLTERVMARFENTDDWSDGHRLTLDGPPSVHGMWDAERLDQVLTNLISNALKYSPDGGEIRLILESREDEATIQVIDSGIGMSAEDQSRAFEPFRRSEAARRTADGTGLGLFIARRMIEQHSGSIAVDSEVGVGTPFTVTLPLSAPTPTP